MVVSHIPGLKVHILRSRPALETGNRHQCCGDYKYQHYAVAGNK